MKAMRTIYIQIFIHTLLSTYIVHKINCIEMKTIDFTLNNNPIDLLMVNNNTQTCRMNRAEW